MRFHVLGVGSIGTLISHHLRLANASAPISLIVRKGTANPPPKPRDDAPIWLSVQRANQRSTSKGFDIEKYDERRRPQPPDPSRDDINADAVAGPIDSLVVCLKTHATLPAVRTLAHRLSPNSVITLLQNGMGVYDQLCSVLFPDPETRPHFVIGTTTHGVTFTKHFGVVQHRSKLGDGEIRWGVAPDPRGEVDLEQPSSTPTPTPNLDNLRTTLETLLSMRSLSPSLLPMPHLHHQLLLKLALNATINPLTAILGVGALPNDSLVAAEPGYRLIRLLSAETSAVLTAYLHSLSSPHSPPPDVVRLFSPESLEKRTFALCRATSTNISSMAMDTGRGRETEIDSINGYMISLGVRLGIPTPSHRLVTEMVKFATSVNGLDPMLAGMYRQAVVGAREERREVAREAMTERELSLREREVAVAEGQLKLAVQDKKRELRANSKDSRKAYRAMRMAQKMGRDTSGELVRASVLLYGKASDESGESSVPGEAVAVDVEESEAAHWAGVGSQDFVASKSS
ncbi:2-dehydropantoate 2-reductase (Ketopantoate reductase) (KPA reductase) (KPR) [Saitozyma podzolica]|uniref:2-dehydropantoate 2-reductase n=1 Tax=Saitozyma podzolica TaxID=1890683 RepID=A0A427YW04_9TREE|nr:2-dehydropantoate 2-reductase (Ketopantoate reductase) (KPA reductase) (KPR) [Saitozyma podzolica]